MIYRATGNYLKPPWQPSNFSLSAYIKSYITTYVSINVYKETHTASPSIPTPSCSTNNSHSPQCSDLFPVNRPSHRSAHLGESLWGSAHDICWGRAPAQLTRRRCIWSLMVWPEMQTNIAYSWIANLIELNMYVLRTHTHTLTHTQRQA